MKIMKMLGGGGLKFWVCVRGLWEIGEQLQEYWLLTTKAAHFHLVMFKAFLDPSDSRRSAWNQVPFRVHFLEYLQPSRFTTRNGFCFFLLSVWTSRPHLCCQWILPESRWQIFCCRWRNRRLPAHFYRAKSQAWLQTELDEMKFCYQLIITTTKFVMFLALFKIKTQKIQEFSCMHDGVYYSIGTTHTVLLHCPIASQSGLRILL